jgi:uncharacterized protein (DUF302 family)
MSDHGLRITVAEPFDHAEMAVREALAEHGFGVLTEIDVAATMKNKLGVDMDAYLILGACNPPLAHRALQVDPSVGLLLPCNVTLRAAPGGEVVIEAMDPDLVVGLTGNPELEEIAADARIRLAAAMSRIAESAGMRVLS